MKSNLTIKEIRSIVRSTLEEMKLGLASYRTDLPPTDLSRSEKQTFLKQTNPPVQFSPDVESRRENDWKRNWHAAVSNPMANFRHFVADDDTDELSDEDYEMMADLANISHESEPRK